MGCGTSVQPQMTAPSVETSYSVDRSKSLSENRMSSTQWKSRVSRIAAIKTYTEEGSLPLNPADIMVDLRTYLDEPLLLCRFGKYVKDHGRDLALLCWADVQEFRPLVESDYRSAQFLFIFNKYLSDATDSGELKMLPSLGIELDSSYYEFLCKIAQEIRSNSQTQEAVSSYTPSLTPSYNQQEADGGEPSTTTCDSHNFDVLQQQCLRLLCDAVFSKFKRTMLFYMSLKDLKNQYNRVVTDDFEYMEKLGQGSYGFVVHCRKKSTGKHYAMKIQTKVGLLDCFNDAPARVVYEKDAVASCSHPFIVGLDYSFQTTTLAIMVTTLGTGGTLGDAAMCCPNNKMPLERVKFYSAEIVLALIHIHRMKLIYRDLKPANVLLNLDGHIQLVDLGGIIDVGGNTLGYHGEADDAAAGLFAVDYAANRPPEASISMSCSNTKHLARGEKTTTMGGATFKQKYRVAERPGTTQRAKSIMGTGGYMAPEMLAMLQDDSLSGYTHAVDYWSLGVTMYKLLSGSLPFHDSHVNMFYDFLASSLASPLPQNGDTISQPVGKHPAYVAFERRLRSDPRMTEATIDILLGFLEVEEKKRLGYGKRGYRHIKQHRFFREYDWNLFPSKQIVPPRVDTMTGDYAPMEEFGMPSADSADESELHPVTDFAEMMSSFGKDSWLTLAPQSCEQQYFQNWDFVSPQILKYEMGLIEEQQAMAAEARASEEPSKNTFMSNQLNRISTLLHIGSDASHSYPDSVAIEIDRDSNLASKSVSNVNSASSSHSKDQSAAVMLNELFRNSTDTAAQLSKGGSTPSF